MEIECGHPQEMEVVLQIVEPWVVELKGETIYWQVVNLKGVAVVAFAVSHNN